VPFVTPATIEQRAQQMDISMLDQQLSQQEAELAKEKARLQEWNERLTAVKSSSIQIVEQLQAAARRLNEIQIELATLTDSTEENIGNYDRMLGLRAEQVKLNAETKLNQLRQRSHNLHVELLGMERDVSQKAVEEQTIILNAWQAEVHKRRQQDATEALQSAQEALGLAQTLPKIIQDQFDINIQLSTELEEITREEADLNAQYRAYLEDLNALQSDFATAIRRFELTELSEAMGLVMRKKRLYLPSARLFVEDSRNREARMSAISEKQIAMDEMLRQLSSPKALVQRLAGSFTFFSDVDRHSFDLKIQELITIRI
jgi:small-conductance mechanosensitive channel